MQLGAISIYRKYSNYLFYFAVGSSYEWFFFMKIYLGLDGYFYRARISFTKAGQRNVHLRQGAIFSNRN